MNALFLTGEYHNCVIELASPPGDLLPGRVRVLVMPYSAEEAAPPPVAPRLMTWGMFRANDAQMSTEEDFKEAEWHGEARCTTA